MNLQSIKALNDELKPKYSGISASSLSWIDVSPLYFKLKLDKKIVDDSTAATELGNQTHVFLLENKDFNNRYTVLNFDKPRGDKQKEFCELCANSIRVDETLTQSQIAIPAYKLTYTTIKKSEEKIKEEAVDLYIKLKPYIVYLLESSSDKKIITQGALKYLRDVREVVKKHDKASDLLFNNGDDFIANKDVFIANELKIHWEHPTLRIDEEPIVLKSIIDRLYIDHKNKIIRLIDLKTSSKLYIFEDKFEEYNYKRQMGFYWGAIEYMFKRLCSDKDISEYKQETYIVAVQTPDFYKKAPVECKAVWITPETVVDGKNQVNDKLEELIWHFERDSWAHTRDYYEKNGIDLIL